MKRILSLTVLITSLLTMISVKSEAQDMKFGAKGGLNFATIYGEDAEDVGMRGGIHLGGFARIGFTDMISLQPELAFSQKGGRDTEGQSVYRLNLNYFDLPILAHFNFDGISVHAGPQFGFLLGASNVYKDEEEKEKDSPNDLSEVYNIVDIGLAAGAGYEMDNGLLFGMRFNFGLRNVAAEREFLGQTFQPEYKNFNLQLYGGYAF